jgi:hypothetical protein
MLTAHWIEIGYFPVVPVVKIVWKCKRDFHPKSAIWHYSELVDAFENAIYQSRVAIPL